MIKRPRSPVVRFTSVLFGAGLLLSCGEGESTPTVKDSDSALQFNEVSANLGLDFVHTSGVNGDYRFPEIMGSGAAIFDHDQDGLLDIYLINGGDPHRESRRGMNRLFRQMPDGQFEDRTSSSGLGDRGYGMGAAIGDVDNDGRVDVYVTNLRQDRIYRNAGDGVFEDMTDSSLIDVDSWSTSAAFCDLNGDELLDLYVATYVVDDSQLRCKSATGKADYCAPNMFRATPDRLFINQGDFRFEERPIFSSGVAKPNPALGVFCADLSDDGHLDLFVANDGTRNFLLINEGDGSFKERGVPWGVATNFFGEAEASMGIDVADLNSDGSLDIFVTHLDSETDTLYMSDHGFYNDTTSQFGLAPLTMRDSGFGTAFADFDHDGDVDLLTVNGNVRQRDSGEPITSASNESTLEDFRSTYSATNRLFFNNGLSQFLPVDNAIYGIEDQSGVSRGLITVDIDGDGDLDALVTDSNSSPKLYLNDLSKKGNWVQLRVLNSDSKRDAVGSIVRIRTDGEMLLRPVVHTRGYLTSQDATVHFGVGEAESIDEAEVTWPDGTTESFGPLESNRVHSLIRGMGTSST